jgi:hypothetical protein
MTAKLGMFLLISVALTMTIFLFQTSLTKTAELMGTSAPNMVSAGDSIQQFDKGGYTLDNDLVGVIQNLDVESQANVEEGTGNVFSDAFKSVRNWILKLPGIRHIIGPLNALPTFFSGMFPGDYKEVGFALGYLWYAIVAVTLIMWIRGGSQ